MSEAPEVSSRTSHYNLFAGDGRTVPSIIHPGVVGSNPTGARKGTPWSSLVSSLDTASPCGRLPCDLHLAVTAGGFLRS